MINKINLGREQDPKKEREKRFFVDTERSFSLDRSSEKLLSDDSAGHALNFLQDIHTYMTSTNRPST